MPLPAYLPTSPNGLAMTKLRRMVSMSSAFQTRTGLGETECLERVHFHAAADTATMPFAVIVPQPCGYRTFSVGSQNHLRPFGTLLLWIECEPHPEFDQLADQRHEAVDFFDAVLAEVAALSAVDDPASEDGTSHLAINDVTPNGFAMETPEHTQASTGVLFWATYSIDWGYQG